MPQHAAHSNSSGLVGWTIYDSQWANFVVEGNPQTLRYLPDWEFLALRVNPTSPFRCRRRDLVVVVVAVVVVVVTDGNFDWNIDWFRERFWLTLSPLGCSWGPRGTIGHHFGGLLVWTSIWESLGGPWRPFWEVRGAPLGAFSAQSPPRGGDSIRAAPF